MLLVAIRVCTCTQGMALSQAAGAWVSAGLLRVRHARDGCIVRPWEDGRLLAEDITTTLTPDRRETRWSRSTSAGGRAGWRRRSRSGKEPSAEPGSHARSFSTPRACWA